MIRTLRFNIRGSFSLAAIAFPVLAHSTVIDVSIGIDQAPPYHWIDTNDQAQGSIVKAIESLVTKSGGIPKFISCPWSRCLKLVESGQVDMLLGVKKTGQRELFLDFVEPPIIDAVVSFIFYQRTDAIPLKSYNHLHHIRVGVLRGAHYFDAFDTDKNINKVEFNELESALASLRKGRIDALIKLAGVSLPPNEENQKLMIAEYKHTEQSKGYIALSKKFPHPSYKLKLSNELANSSELKSLLIEINKQDSNL